ncbi:hypothetical protein ACFFQW_32700 [Umezawaea endophytica]|uniref:Secreted protein with PEP-CTERM sorting signal n=1 Tax=Umezawaea endophytica TaxID=1654476 RepID=A0A9X3AJD3_9PSEU|nr:hypothetical protein [Umezawaea endophytica]MCS7483856.1 hypothetical protein [Umezawaea endophytica]
MRGRSAALSLVVVSTTSVLLSPGVALAADGTVARTAFDSALAGPVGVGAVAVGVIGLVTGFLRRRKGVVVSEQNQRVVTPPTSDTPTPAPATTQA